MKKFSFPGTVRKKFRETWPSFFIIVYLVKLVALKFELKGRMVLSVEENELNRGDSEKKQKILIFCI